MWFGSLNEGDLLDRADFIPDLSPYFFLGGLSLFVLASYLAYQAASSAKRDTRVPPIGVAGSFLGLTLWVIAALEKASFYEVNAGIFASLVVAFAASGPDVLKPKGCNGDGSESGSTKDSDLSDDE